MRLLAPLSRRDRQQLSVERGIERRYRIRERLADGAVYRTFWFADRDDADAFLYAAITGSLRYERELWKLATPRWEPAPWVDVTYDFAALVAITSTSSSTQSWTVPSDFNAANNSIQAIGAGGSGAQASITNAAAGGGGGGGWARVLNAPLVRTSSVAFILNVGAVGPLGTGSTTGGPGFNTWMRIDGGSSAPGTATQGVLGAGGGGGLAGTGTIGGGAGGTANVGSSTNNGGGGSAAIGSGGAAAGGGGGAGGPLGAGASLGAPTNTWGAGGQGGGAAGGAGGGAAGVTGSNGSEIGAGWGSGGGGAGVTVGGTGGFGGAAGGGGAGASFNLGGSNTRGGDGGQGLLFVTYTPPVPVGFNMPMLGM